MRLRLLLFALLASLLGASPTTVVTAANLLEHEHAWPYRVALTQDWQPTAGAALSAGTVGVLIRVEAGGVARIDFARDGKYEVPIESTDLVASANRILKGELAKPAPNFVYSLAGRVLDAASDPLTALPPEKFAARQNFVCVFADVRAKDFAQLAASLRPLAKRSDIALILFAQGAAANAEIRDRLRANDWLVPFLYDHLAEAYTRTLLRDGTSFPNVMVVTDEGRVLFQSAWRPDVVSQLSAAVDAAHPGDRS